MSVYPFVQELSLGDMDRSTLVRHHVPADRQRLLSSNHIHKLQSRLRELGFEYMIGNVDGCFNHKLRGTILAFQAQAAGSERVVVDATAGTQSRAQVARTWQGAQNGRVDEATANEISVWLVQGFRNCARVPLEKLGHTWVRPEVACAIHRVADRLLSKGCHLPLEAISGFRHPANVDRSVGKKAESLHCAGLAIDLDEWRGMQLPATDLFFVEKDLAGQAFWRILMRSHLASVEQRSIDAYYFSNATKAFSVHLVHGRFVDVTREFLNEGLVPIDPHAGWEHEYYKSEWWHFQLGASDGSWMENMEAAGFPRDFLFELGYGRP